MKFEKKVEIAKKRGYALMTREEFTKLLIRAGDTIIYIAFGCVHCGRAYGEKDFTEIFYVVYPEKYDEEEAQGLFGDGGGAISYGIVAKCRYCGHSEVYSEPEDVC